MEGEARWFHSVWWVLFSLFFLIGPFALPLLWKSPRFSRGMKVVLTLASVAYTALLIDETVRAARMAMTMVDSLGGM